MQETSTVKTKIKYVKKMTDLLVLKYSGITHLVKSQTQEKDKDYNMIVNVYSFSWTDFSEVSNYKWKKKFIL